MMGPFQARVIHLLRNTFRYRHGKTGMRSARMYVPIREDLTTDHHGLVDDRWMPH